MVTVIYVDVLLAVNIFVTYILLVCTRVILKKDTNKYGILIAAVLGGASSLIIFWEDMPLFLSVIYKLVVGVVISFSAFLPESKKLVFKTSVAFFFVNFIFGGLMYFFEVTFNMSNIIYMNGTVYFDISVLFLVAMTLICYGLLLLGDYILKRRASEGTIYETEVFLRGKSVLLKALYDTGNHVTDGLVGKPVIITQVDALVDLFDLTEINYLKGNLTDSEVAEGLKNILRIIPCSSVSGETILKGFVPEKIIIKNNKIRFETEYVIVAVTNGDLMNGEYNCILNSAIFERGRVLNDTKVKK